MPYVLERSLYPLMGGVSGEKAYLLRLCPEKDPAPLVAAAKRYLDEDVQYDYPDLIFFAGLLIYRAVRPTPRWQKITDLILNMACFLIWHAGNSISCLIK